MKCIIYKHIHRFINNIITFQNRKLLYKYGYFFKQIHLTLIKLYHIIKRYINVRFEKSNIILKYLN